MTKDPTKDTNPSEDSMNKKISESETKKSKKDDKVPAEDDMKKDLAKIKDKKHK